MLGSALCPTVMTYEFLKTHALKSYCDTEEAKRIVDKEGLDFSDIDVLHLEFQNILRITNLQDFTNLVELQLSNNRIEIIEGLDGLQSLVRLDLSFNNITYICGLSKLHNLEDLSLTKNRIKKIRHLDDLKKLRLLSLKDNLIKSEKCFHYLQKFITLQSLCLIGNPVSETSDYIFKVITFVPSLLYLDYALIRDEQRLLAEERCSIIAAELEEKAEHIAKIANTRKVNENKLKGFKEAFVEHLGESTFFYNLLADDLATALAFKFDSLEEQFTKFRKAFNGICKQWVEMAMTNLKKRKEETEMFSTTVNRLKSNALEQQRIEVLEFSELTEKWMMELSVEEEVETSLLNEHQASFQKILSTLWKKLLDLEMPLHEKLISLTVMYGDELKILSESGVKAAESFRVQMKELSEQHMTTVNEFYQEWFSKTQKEKNQLLKANEVSKLKRPRLYSFLQKEKEDIVNCLSNYSIHRMNKIDEATEKFISQLKEYEFDSIADFQEQELERHRKNLIEIHVYCDASRNEFAEVFAYLKYGAKMSSLFK